MPSHPDRVRRNYQDMYDIDQSKLKDGVTGISIRFVKEYDVDADKRPKFRDVRQLQAWTKAHRNERDVSLAERRPFNWSRFWRRYDSLMHL